MNVAARSAALLLSLALATVVRAVIVFGGDGTQNVADFATDDSRNRVGVVNGCAGVYLGSVGGADWVLTANHVGAGSFTLDAVAYSAVSGSAVRLTNTDGSAADLILYRIDSSLDWSVLSVSSSPLAIGSSVTMIGNGYNRASAVTTWYVNDSAWSTTQSAGTEAVTGYYYGSGNILRWGTNTVSGASALLSYNNTVCETTTFNAIAGEAQGAVGDSGGGVFGLNAGGEWTLSGIMLAIAGFSGQPSAAVVGNTTYFADLSAYRSQILTTIPEPAVAPVLLGLATLGAAVWLRRRR
jgi:hypothetical protein